MHTLTKIIISPIVMLSILLDFFGDWNVEILNRRIKKYWDE